MTDIASLGIQVDTKQVVQGSAALDNLTAAGARTESSTKKLSDTNSRAEIATRKLADASRLYESSILRSKDASQSAQQQTLSFIASLERQIALHGKSATEALRYDSALLGMTKTQSEHVQQLLKTAQAQEESNQKVSSSIQVQEAATQKTLGLISAVKLLATSYAAFKVFEYAKEATMLQARYETLGVAMTVVGRSAGYTKAEMEAASQSLQKTGITMIESRQAILRLVQAQIDLKDASRLARIAQDAAVIGNVNSSEAFARLIHGIQSGQTEVLRMLGINISMEQSYAKMAATLGITSNQLTQTQKTQAVLGAVFEQGAIIAGTYEAAMGTAGKQLLSMQRYVENLKVTLGETFNEALVIGVESVTAGFKGLNDEAKDLAVKNQLRDWGRQAIMIAANVIDAFRLIKNTFVQAGNGIMFLVQATKLAVTGQFEALKELSAAQEKENAEFVKGITLVSDLAQARFTLIDAEKANAAATADTATKTGKGSDAALQNAAALKKAEDAYKTLISGIKEKISIQQLELSLEKDLTDAQKVTLDVMVKLRDGELKLSNARKIKVTGMLEELNANEQLVTNMQFSKKASEDLVATGQKEVLSIQQQITTLREQNAQIGMTAEQIVALTGAKNLEQAANLRNAAAYAGPLHDAYMTYANDLEKLAGLQKELVTEQQIQKNAQQWTQIGQSIEQTGKNAFIQFAAHGVSAMQSIGQAIKLSIYDVLYQLTLRKWTINIITSLTNSLSSGAANGLGSTLGSMGSSLGSNFSLMNIASGAKSIFSAFTGGASGLVEAVATSAVGQALGLGVAGGSTLGAGVGIGGIGAAGAGAGAGTAFIGGAGTALGGTGATVAGMSGAGAMLAAAAGPLAIAAAADMIFRLIAGNKTIKGAEALTYVPVIGPLINALFGMGPKKLGPAELTGTFSDTGFSGQFEADWTRKAGLFAFGKKKGRRGLGISSEQDAALDAMVTNISDSFMGLTKITGDADRSLAGWTFQVKQAIDTEEQQEQLTKDLSNSIGEKLIPELTLIQQKDEELADTAARAAGEFKLMNAVLDLTGMTLSKVGLASLGMRDNIVQLLGGLDSASNLLQTFFNDFYTDSERTASSLRLLTTEFNQLGVATPTTREQFRALVEAQDLNTEAGQKMFAALIELVPAFSSVTDAIGKAADDAAAEAKRVADSIRLLTTDSFKTLFDYTKYIKQAQIAGVTAAQPAGPIFEAPAPVFQSFAVGTNSVPYDMMAKIHKDERIVPAADNKALINAVNKKDDSALLNEVRHLKEEQRAQAIALAKNTSSTVDVLNKLNRIITQWDSGNGYASVKVIA